MTGLAEIKYTTKGEIKFKRESNYSGIVLHEYEINLLHHIHIHKQMRSTSLHKLYLFLSGRDMYTNTISHRLTKLVSSGVLFRMEERVYDLSGNFVRYYYKLGLRGYAVLEEKGFIQHGEAMRQFQNNRASKIPMFHSKAAGIIANEISIECLNNDELANMIFARGNAHSIFGTTAKVSVDMKGIIIPDYVFEYKDVYVCIEIDTGYQRRNIIKSKYERYKKKAASLKEKGKKIIVVFVVVDDSISNDSLGEREKRVHSLKNMFPPFSEWGDSLLFYAVRAVNSPKLVMRLLTKKEPVPQMAREFICDDWIDSVKMVEQQRLDVERYAASDFHQNAASHVNADGFFKTTEYGKRSKSYALLYMNEGSVTSYQIFQANIKRMEFYNESSWNQHNVIEYNLMLLYDDITNAKEDVISVILPENGHIFITDIKTWQQKQFNETNKDISTSVYELVSPFRKVLKEGYRL